MNSTEIIKTLETHLIGYPLPLTDTMINEYGRNPYIILISCLLSLRARDIVTVHVCRDLFSQARTPQEIVNLDRQDLEKIIYKTGSYKRKAEVLQNVSQILIDSYDGNVPETQEKLLALPGVGLKTANLVLGLAFGKNAICVDTHVHRISNIFGLIKTKTPDESEEVLRQVLPEKFWIRWNTLLVILGQNICTPPTPKCSQCPLNNSCPKIGVTKQR